MKTSLLGTLIATSAIVATAALPLAANAGEVGNRVHRQQSRIQQGVQSGQLTRGEYQRDAQRLKAINAQRNLDLRQNGGQLTAAQKRQLNGALNRNSQQIYFSKHDRARQAGTPLVPREAIGPVPSRTLPGEVADRVERQWDRIQNGVRSGQLTAGEYNRDVSRLRAINQQRLQFLRQNGGFLTPQQKQQLNQELGNSSGGVYFTKHDRADQPGV